MARHFETSVPICCTFSGVRRCFVGYYYPTFRRLYLKVKALLLIEHSVTKHTATWRQYLKGINPQLHVKCRVVWSLKLTAHGLYWHNIVTVWSLKLTAHSSAAVVTSSVTCTVNFLTPISAHAALSALPFNTKSQFLTADCQVACRKQPLIVSLLHCVHYDTPRHISWHTHTPNVCCCEMFSLGTL
jgi:hypothetical protein